MGRRRRIVEVLCAGLVGAAALGALSSACNSLSGIGDFAVGDAANPTEDVAVNQGDGASEAQGDAPAPDQDATATEGSTSDGPALSDGQREATEASEAALGVGDGPVEGAVTDGGEGGGGGDAGDAGDGAADTGGGTGSCDGGALVVHSDGLGETFTDCAPLGTYNLTQALEACAAHLGDAGACVVDPVACAGDQVCGSTSTVCTCWKYNGGSAGHVQSFPTTCGCLGVGSPTWN